MRNRKQKRVLENMMLKCREDQRKKLLRWRGMTTNRTSRRITRWAGARVGNCMTDAPVGDGGERALLQRTHAVQELVSLLHTGTDESVTINEREIKKDWGFLSTTWTIASLAMSSTG